MNKEKYIQKKAKKLLENLYAKSKKVFNPVPLFKSHSESAMTKNLADPVAMDKALKSMSPINLHELSDNSGYAKSAPTCPYWGQSGYCSRPDKGNKCDGCEV